MYHHKGILGGEQEVIIILSKPLSLSVSKRQTESLYIYYQAEKVADPVIKNSLFRECRHKDYFISAAGISLEASKYFKTSDSTQPRSEIVEKFPAMTLKTNSVGPNGNQKYEVSATKISMFRLT